MRLFLVLAFAALGFAADRPKRINRAIELLEQGQPIDYTHGHGGFEEGKNMAQTWATTSTTRWSTARSTSTTFASSCASWSRAVPRRTAT